MQLPFRGFFVVLCCRPDWRINVKLQNSMTKLRNLLRCYAIGMSIKSISSAFHLSRNTVRKYVRKYVRRYQESGLTLDQLMTMSEEKLQEMFLDNQNRSRKPSARMDELEALIPDYVKRLSRKGVTVKSLHEEYLREHPDGYKYSTFKRAVRRQKYHVRVVGHVDHLAGDQMYIDYAGDKLEVVDAETGEVRCVEVFVAILPCSHYTYCEAVWSQKKEDLIVACENALHFFGGAPMAVVPDNLKAAVTRSKEAHKLPGRHGSYEKDLGEIYERARAIDNILLNYLREVAAQKKYLPLAFRTCKGIISLEKKYGLARLVAACACASEGRQYGYNEVLEILKRGDDVSFMPSDDDTPDAFWKSSKTAMTGNQSFSLF